MPLLKEYSAKLPGPYAPVSLQTPLLSNLSVVENIALIEEVHQNLCYKEARAHAQNGLERLGFCYIAESRIVTCSAKELFIAQLVRAATTQYDKIVITSPFVMLNESEGISFLLDILKRLETDQHYIILDMITNREKYEAGGCQCTIVK